jgi:hypothetical protein
MARPGLTSTRKFRRLAAVLGSRIMARGVLELLWDSCYETLDDVIGTSEELEQLVGWTGDRGALTRALLEAGAPDRAGFIELVIDGRDPIYRVHDLWHHAPRYILQRRRRELQHKTLYTQEIHDIGAKRRRNEPKPAPNGAAQNQSGRPQIRSAQIRSAQISSAQVIGPAAPVAAPLGPTKERPIYESPTFAVFAWMDREYQQRLEVAGRAEFDLFDWYGTVSADLVRRGESLGLEPHKYLLERLYVDAALPKPSLTGRKNGAAPRARDPAVEAAAKTDRQDRQEQAKARETAVNAYLEAMPADEVTALEEKARDELRMRHPGFRPKPADLQRMMRVMVDERYRGQPIPATAAIGSRGG